MKWKRSQGVDNTSHCSAKYKIFDIHASFENYHFTEVKLQILQLSHQVSIKYWTACMVSMKTL